MTVLTRITSVRFAVIPGWLVLGMLFFSLAIVAGCSTTQQGPIVPSDQPQGVAGKAVESGTNQSSQVTKDSAVSLVEKQPEVEEYKRNVESAGFKFFIKATETKSRFVVRVGEEHPEKVTVTSWYVVSKADGQVKKWDLTQGSPLDE